MPPLAAETLLELPQLRLRVVSGREPPWNIDTGFITL
jgi:hypothetical protein